MLAQRGRYVVFARLELVPDLLCTTAVFIALESGRQCGQQVFHQLLHIVAQFTATTGRQLQCVRPVRLTEVCDVTPVTGRRPRRRVGRQCLVQEVMFADARRTHDVQIVATAFDAGGKLDRLQHPFLPQRRLLRRQLSGIGEIQCRAVTRMNQLAGRQCYQRPRPAMRCRQFIGHRYSGNCARMRSGDCVDRSVAISSLINARRVSG